MQPKVDEVKNNSEKGFQKSRQAPRTNTNPLWQAAYSDFMQLSNMQTQTQSAPHPAVLAPFNHPPDFLDFSLSPSIYSVTYTH